LDHRELTALAGDPARLRALAAHLLKFADDRMAEASREYLARLSAYDGSRRLGVAQLEWLHDLRERSKRYRMLGPYRAAKLVETAFQARVELDDEGDEAWLAELKARGGGISVTRAEALRLLAMARRLEIIPSGEWIEL
jgi:hypothetical protein